MNIEIEIEKLNSIIEPLTKVTDEAIIRVNEDGLIATMSDKSRVSLIEARLNLRACKVWEVEEIHTLPLNLKKLQGYLKVCDSSDIVSLIHKDNKIIIKVKDELTKIELLLLDESNITQPEIPDLDYFVRIDVPFDKFKKGVKFSEKVSNEITFKTTDDGEKKRFMILSNDMGNKVELEFDDEYDLLATPPADEIHGESCFKVVNISSFINVIKAETIRIHTRESYPIRIDYQIEEGSITFLTAPRIDEK